MDQLIGGKVDLNEAMAKLAAAARATEAQKAGYAGELKNWMIRRKMMATLWLIGTSYAQLSKLFQITRPSVKQAIDKETSNHSQRIYHPSSVKTRMSFDAVSWYYERMAERPDQVAALSADQLVVWLTTELPYTGD